MFRTRWISCVVFNHFLLAADPKSCPKINVYTMQEACPKGSGLETDLYRDVPAWRWPIVYSPLYNLQFFGITSLHGFDGGKWGRVHSFLKDVGMLTDASTVSACEAQPSDLLVVHVQPYLDALKRSSYVASILEFFPLMLVPNSMVQSRILTPFRYQTGGSILAGKLAVERGWAINIGGGFHHSHGTQGGGFCVYADITLAIRFLQKSGKIKTAMIIDLDAHQGNGHERDFLGNRDVFILDVYNGDIYPNDKWAKTAIKKKVEVRSGIQDDEYLSEVESAVKDSLDIFKPDLLLYNAGTDIMSGDPLGAMNVSAEGIIKRDEIVFREARSRGVPILMVTSGGYQATTARVIADSILNLKEKKLIEPPSEEPPEDALQQVQAPSGIFSYILSPLYRILGWNQTHSPVEGKEATGNSKL